MPAMRPCAEPGCAVLLPKSGRCSTHRRDSPTTTQRTWPERQRRAQAVRQWVQLKGYVCPGYGVPSHPSRDLTADHLLAVVNGGGDGPLVVLCRSCNSRKSDR